MALINLSIALLLSGVNAASAKTSLSSLIENTVAEGKVSTLGEAGDKYLNLIGLELKKTEVGRADAEDNLTHAFNVGSDKQGPKCLVFTTHARTAKGFTLMGYRATLSGKLEAVLQTLADYDETGKPIPASGKFTMLDPGAKEEKKIFRHELDFWLKGKYRKPSGQKTSATK